MKMSEAIGSFSEWRSLKVKNQTVKGYDRELRFLCLYLRDPEIEEITLSDVTGYMRGHLDLGWDENSLLPKVMAVRKFIEFYRRQGYKVFDEELVPVPPKTYKLPRVADDDAFAALLASVPEKTNDPRHIRNAAIIRLLWDTGARNGEILSLNVGDLDLAGRQAIIRTEKSKGRRPFRQVFWTEETGARLERWLVKREQLKRRMEIVDGEALFVSICSSMHDTGGRRFSIKGVGEMLRRYCNRAGIPYQNAHSFRHRKGHVIIRTGGSTADVMNILGHSSVQSTTVYTMMAGVELEERARRFMPGPPAVRPRGCPGRVARVGKVGYNRAVCRTRTRTKG